MDEDVIDALRAFDENLHALEDALTHDAVREAVFADTHDWIALLRHKLIPRLAGPECLTVAVAGGTNSGKSTVFNLLLGGDTSPVRATAAATCHPVIAAAPDLAKRCLEGKIYPEFKAIALDDPNAVIGHEAPDDQLFVVESDALPEGIVLMDTPDVDSIDTANWTIAENIRAAGDIVIAVLTGEKYKDDRVVNFFRAAHESGRVVVPVMNKADKNSDYEIARGQLAEFRNDTGVKTEPFLFPFDSEIRESFKADIISEDGESTLTDYLANLDTSEVRDSVYRQSVVSFAKSAGGFLTQVDKIEENLSGVLNEFNNRAADYAQKYDPVPGEAIGGLLHEYVQARRGPVRKFLGNAGGTVAKGVVSVGSSVRKAILERVNLEPTRIIASAEDVKTVHEKEIARLARELATSYLASCPNLAEPAQTLIKDGSNSLQVDDAVDRAAKDLIGDQDLSEDFRAHAKVMLDEWWNDPTSSRRFIEAADSILAVAPAAVAAFVGINTAGLGTAELTAVTWPLAQQLATRAFEHSFGDRIFDFLKPWREERREKFLEAVLANVTEPVTGQLESNLAPLQGDILETLRSSQRTCLIDSPTS